MLLQHPSEHTSSQNRWTPHTNHCMSDFWMYIFLFFSIYFQFAASFQDHSLNLMLDPYDATQPIPNQIAAFYS